MTGPAAFKGGFFDAAAVTSKVAAAERRALSKFGAFVRTRARSSIRKGKKPAAPGKPPNSHAGDLKRLLFFAYDPAASSVVVGPVPFREGAAPALLEYGGQSARKTRSGYKRAFYRGNPFMTPAFEAEKPNAAKFFEGTVK